MKNALNYIEFELTSIGYNIESFNKELDKTDLIVSKAFWQQQLNEAKAVRSQLLTIQKMLQDENK